MPKLAPFFVVILCAAFVGASYVTTAFWAGTASATEATAHTMADSQSGNLGKTSVAQTYNSLETTPGLSTMSGQRVLVLQSATPNNTAQARNLLTNNVTR
ncbi:MAG: hypothetical protein ACXV4B_09455, partial [Halobacteriota archaeon]